MYVRESKSVGHGALFSFKVIEIGQLLQVDAQMDAVGARSKHCHRNASASSLRPSASITSRRISSHSNGIQQGLFSSTALIALQATLGCPAAAVCRPHS